MFLFFRTKSRAGDSNKTAVNLKTGQASHTNPQYNANPYANNTTTVTAKIPSRKPPPPPPAHTTQSSRYAPPTVSSSSPRPGGVGTRTPGKLPQIASYNQMDANASNVKKPYR